MAGRRGEQLPVEAWDVVENMTGACRGCNARKGSKPLLHFLLAELP